MNQTSPCWAFGDDVQSFQYYTQQLADMWPQKLVISSICASACAFFHADALLVWMWFIAISADFLVGVFKARFYEGKIDPHKLIKGVVKFPTYFLYLLIAGAVDVSINRYLVLLGASPVLPILNGFFLYFICTELSSVTQSLEDMGLKVPALLKMLLRKSTNRVEQEIEKIGPTEEEKKDASGTPPDRDI